MFVSMDFLYMGLHTRTASYTHSAQLSRGHLSVS